MISFTIPEKLNGSQLLKELESVGITILEPIVADGFLWLDISEKEKTKAEKVVESHVGIELQPTIQEKLATAGIDLDELRVALGL